MTEKNDLLGIKPYGEALSLSVQKTFQVVEAFLESTCKPALDELGLMLGDKFRVWRLNNILKILEKSKNKFEFSDGEIQLKANPKVALTFIESASIEDNEELQELWAGLFASTCDKNKTIDEDIIYINLLKQLTLPEAKILKYMCENAGKFKRENGVIFSQTISKTLEELKLITGLNDLTSIEIILNHIHSLRLNERDIGTNPSGFLKNSKDCVTYLTPTYLALKLYMKCMGFRGLIEEFYLIQEINKK